MRGIEVLESTVLNHCDVIFALWDGSDNGEGAGTFALVELALRENKPVVWVPVARVCHRAAQLS